MGTEIDPRALSFFVDDLEPLPDEVIQGALARCRREISSKNGFPPALTIKDALDRCGVVSPADVEDAQCRAAWDALLKYAERFVCSDVEGNYYVVPLSRKTGEVRRVPMRKSNQLVRIGRQQVGYCRPVHVVETIQPPKLGQRLFDSLRRIGGWKQIKTITEDDYPHVQRRFYEEFRTWQATESALLQGAMSGNGAFQNLLESKAMPEHRARLPEVRDQAKKLVEKHT
jgi:hypothetical protein